jgi:uncharacterized membrane protein YecN with MAPEG domain
VTTIPFPAITALTAASLALWLLWLSVAVIRERLRAKRALGVRDDDRMLLRAVRAHANFAEYAPMALVLLLLLEVGGAPSWWVGALAAALVAGRVTHALGISREPEALRFRQAGMLLTFGVLGLGALSLAALALG